MFMEIFHKINLTTTLKNKYFYKNKYIYIYNQLFLQLIN